MHQFHGILSMVKLHPTRPGWPVHDSRIAESPNCLGAHFGRITESRVAAPLPRDSARFGQPWRLLSKPSWDAGGIMPRASDAHHRHSCFGLVWYLCGQELPRCDTVILASLRDDRVGSEGCYPAVSDRFDRSDRPPPPPRTPPPPQQQPCYHSSSS